MGKIFDDELFPVINEELFSVLYCDKASRSNALVDVIIGALIIKKLSTIQTMNLLRICCFMAAFNTRYTLQAL